MRLDRRPDRRTIDRRSPLRLRDRRSPDARGDHPRSRSKPTLFRQAVRGAIERHPGLVLVGEAEDGQQALELSDTLEPDVAVLDHRMPTLTGAEVCELLQSRANRPATALLMLSAFEDADLVWGAVSSGAAGYIGKGASPSATCEAIEQVGRGGIAFTNSTSLGITRGFARHLGRSDHQDHKGSQNR